MKRIVCFGSALLVALGLFLYLAGTPVIWRIILSGLLFFALYVLTYGFIKYGR